MAISTHQAAVANQLASYLFGESKESPQKLWSCPIPRPFAPPDEIIEGATASLPDFLDLTPVPPQTVTEELLSPPNNKRIRSPTPDVSS